MDAYDEAQIEMIRKWNETYGDYLLYERQLAVGTVVMYIEWISKFSKFIKKELRDATREDVRGFIRELTQSNKKPQTIANHIAGMRAYYKYLASIEANENLIPLCFFLDNLRIKKERTVRQVPDMDEIERLRITMQAYKLAYNRKKHTGTYRILLRDIAVIEMLIGLGGRSKEIRRLTVQDVDLVNNTALIKGKGGHQRVSIFSHTAQIAISEHLEHSCLKENAIIFPMGQGNLLNYIIKRWAKKAKINPKLHPHSFRHYHVTQSQRLGVPLQAVADQVGHISLNTTRKYTHLDVNYRREEYKNRDL